MRTTLLLLTLLLACAAHAADPVVCTVTTSTGAAASTASPTTGTCSWAPGSTVLMQCTTDTFVDTTTTNGTTPTANTSDQLVDFTIAKDPIPLYLNPHERVISVIAATSAGTCKFMTTLRRKPW